MRTGRVSFAALLLVLASSVLQVSSSNDIYWEGEEEASNEFLEVKHEEPTALDSLKRFKRQWNPFNLFSPKEKEAETATDTIPDDSGSYGKDDPDLDVGSGVPDKSDSEPREKTLRVTFLVMEPYITAYSNRDSPEFLNISRSLANAVDLLFESLPGTQRSSLVRIQSLVNDDFLCKVTLDIVTTRNEDTDTIKDILRNHIKNNGRLGETSVRDGDFSAQLIDPGTTFDCDFNEFSCGENICLPMSVKCNDIVDCRDGSDEYDCPEPDTSEAPPPTESTPDPDDYDFKIDDKDNQNPDDRTSYETTPDYRNTYDATPETPNNYDQTPDNSYNQTLENPDDRYNTDAGPDNRDPYGTNVGPDNRDPYSTNTGTDNRNPYGTNTGPDNRDPYGTNGDPANRDPYGRNAGPDNQSPYGTNAGPDNQSPYGTNAGPDNQSPYGTNAGPDNRDPYGTNADPDNRNLYGTNAGPDNRNPYGTNGGPANRDPYGRNAGPDNRDLYGTNAGPDNRFPYGTNAGPDNRDPYGTNAGPDNRNPYGTNTGPDNRDPYGPSAGPDNRNPYDQNENPDSRPENPDDRNPVASSNTPSSAYDQESAYWPRGDLGGPNDPNSTDKPEDTDTETETDIYDATTSRIFNECPSTHIRCDETRCVESTRRCDGILDCVDGTDEAGCPSRKYTTM